VHHQNSALADLIPRWLASSVPRSRWLRCLQFCLLVPYFEPDPIPKSEGLKHAKKKHEDIWAPHNQKCWALEIACSIEEKWNQQPWRARIISKRSSICKRVQIWWISSNGTRQTQSANELQLYPEHVKFSPRIKTAAIGRLMTGLSSTRSCCHLGIKAFWEFARRSSCTHASPSVSVCPCPLRQWRKWMHFALVRGA